MKVEDFASRRTHGIVTDSLLAHSKRLAKCGLGHTSLIEFLCRTSTC